MVTFTQFSNRPAWSLYLEAPGRKTAPLGDWGGCSMPEGSFASRTSASLGAVDGFAVPPHWRAAAVRTVSRQSPGPGRRVCGSRVNKRAGGLYTGKALSAQCLLFFPTFLLLFSLHFSFKCSFICSTSFLLSSALAFLLPLIQLMRG